MRIALIACLAACGRVGFDDAASFVQTNNAYCVTPSLMECPNPTSAILAPGHLVVVTVTYDQLTPQVSNITDDAGNTYTRVLGPMNWAVSLFRTEAWVGVPTHQASVVTATLTSPAVSFLTTYVDEYAGFTTIDQIAWDAGYGPGPTVSSGRRTITTAPQLIFGHGEGQLSLVTGGAGFTERNLANGNTEEDVIATTSGDYEATFTLSGGLEWTALMLTFR